MINLAFPFPTLACQNLGKLLWTSSAAWRDEAFRRFDFEASGPFAAAAPVAAAVFLRIGISGTLAGSQLRQLRHQLAWVAAGKVWHFVCRPDLQRPGMTGRKESGKKFVDLNYFQCVNTKCSKIIVRYKNKLKCQRISMKRSIPIVHSFKMTFCCKDVFVVHLKKLIHGCVVVFVNVVDV